MFSLTQLQNGSHVCVVPLNSEGEGCGAFSQSTLKQHRFNGEISSHLYTFLFILDCLSTTLIPASTLGISSVNRNAEEPAVCSRFTPKDSADKRLQIRSFSLLRGTQR